MIPSKDNIRLFFLALVLVVVSLVYIDSKSDRIQQHENEIYKFINELGKLDALLDRQVLEIHSWYFRNYDGVNNAYKQYTDLIDSAPDMHPELEVMIPKFKEELGQRFELIERFKSNNSVLRNSLNYLPEIAEKLMVEINLAEQQQKLSSDQANKYKQYVLQTIFQRITDQFIDYEFSPLQADLNIQQIPKNVSPLWSNMNIHINIIIDFKQRNLVVSQELDFISSRESLVELNDKFAEHLKESGEARHQQYLWLVSASISIFALFFLLSLVVKYYRSKQSSQQKEIATDILTGLANRRALMATLTDGARQARDSDSKLGLVFLDLDGFKEVNDTFGHQKGDYVLQKVASNLASSVRKTDTVFRLGGDEFVIVLPDVDTSNISNIANELLLSCELSVNVGEDLINVTGSVGVSLYPNDTLELEELTTFADKAMYEAKKDGKARVKFYSDIA